MFNLFGCKERSGPQVSGIIYFYKDKDEFGGYDVVTKFYSGSHEGAHKYISNMKKKYGVEGHIEYWPPTYWKL